jgi:hypothetical protein
VREWIAAYLERVRQQFELAGQSPEVQRLWSDFQPLLRTSLILLILMLIGLGLLFLRAQLRPDTVRARAAEPRSNGTPTASEPLPRSGALDAMIDNLFVIVFLALGLVALCAIATQTSAFLLRR